MGKKNYFTEKLINPKKHSLDVGSQESEMMKTTMKTTMKDSYLADLASGTYKPVDNNEINNNNGFNTIEQLKPLTHQITAENEAQNYLYTKPNPRNFSERIERKNMDMLEEKQILGDDPDGPEIKKSNRIRSQERVLKSMEVMRPSSKNFGLQNHVSFKYLNKTEGEGNKMRRTPSDLEKMLMAAQGESNMHSMANTPNGVDKNPALKRMRSPSFNNQEMITDHAALQRQFTPKFNESKKFDPLKNTEHEMLTKLLGDMGVQTNQQIVTVIVENAGKNNSNFKNRERMVNTLNPSTNRHQNQNSKSHVVDLNALSPEHKNMAIHQSLQMNSQFSKERGSNVNNTPAGTSLFGGHKVTTSGSGEFKRKAWGQFSALNRFMKNYEMKRAQESETSAPKQPQMTRPIDPRSTKEGLKKSISHPSFAKISERIFGKEDVIDGRMEINKPAFRGKSVGRAIIDPNQLKVTNSTSRRDINLTKLKKRLQKDSQKKFSESNQQNMKQTLEYSRNLISSQESERRQSNQLNNQALPQPGAYMNHQNIAYPPPNYVYVPVQTDANGELRYTFSQIGQPNFMIPYPPNRQMNGSLQHQGIRPVMQPHPLPATPYQVRRNIYSPMPMTASNYMMANQAVYHPHVQNPPPNFQNMVQPVRGRPQGIQHQIAPFQQQAQRGQQFIPSNGSNRISEDVVLGTPTNVMSDSLGNRSNTFIHRSANRQISPFVKYDYLFV